ncbi:hypothetical protein ACSLOR_29140, partial [Klebsiella pneumoniae]
IKSDAQISGGETRQDYKDPRRFPLVAPSCALLFLPFGLPVSFHLYQHVALTPVSHIFPFPHEALSYITTPP